MPRRRWDTTLVAYGHGDHMGDAVARASRLRPAWPCIHEMSLWLVRRLPGGNEASTGMNKGGPVEVAGLRVTMTTADNSAGDWTRTAVCRSTWGTPIHYGTYPILAGTPAELRATLDTRRLAAVTAPRASAG